MDLPVATLEDLLSLAIAAHAGRAHAGSAQRNTLFKSRPGDAINLGSTLVRAASCGFVRDRIPPIAYKAIRRVWNRRFSGQ